MHTWWSKALNSVDADDGSGDENDRAVLSTWTEGNKGAAVPSQSYSTCPERIPNNRPPKIAGANVP